MEVLQTSLVAPFILIMAKEFSKSFDEIYNYFSSIQNSDIMDYEIRKNIKKYREMIINNFANFENSIKTKIIELSILFKGNNSFNTIYELIDETLEIKINIHKNENKNENENLTFTKSIDENHYNNFCENYNNINSITRLSEKQKSDSEIEINSNNTIKENLKCYGCGNEGTIQCTNKECCNFILCKNCIELCNKNNVITNHNLKEFEKEEEYKDIEMKKEKYLDLIFGIFSSFFIKINFLFEKEKFPSFPDIKLENWQKKYLDEIEQFYNNLNINNNDSCNLKEPKICKRLIKKYLDKINFKLPIFIYFMDIEKINYEYMIISDFINIDDKFVNDE